MRELNELQKQKYDKAAEYFADKRRYMTNMTAMKLGGDYMLAEDIVQDSFERALKYIDTYDISIKFSRWHSMILSNSMKKIMNEERNKGMSNKCEITQSNEPSFDDSSAEDEDMIRRVKEIIDETYSGDKNFEKRQALYMSFIMGFEPREIANVCPYGAKVISRMVLIFIDVLKDKYADELISLDLENI